MKKLKEFEESLKPSLQKMENFRLSQLQANKIALWYYVLPAIIAVCSIPVYWKINPVFIIISGWFKIQSNLERVRIMPFRCIENPALNSRAVC